MTTKRMLWVGAALGLAMSSGLDIGERRSVTVEAKKRPCLFCGTMHTHNNAFCSAKCCRDHRECKP